MDQLNHPNFFLFYQRRAKSRHRALYKVSQEQEIQSKIEDNLFQKKTRSKIVFVVITCVQKYLSFVLHLANKTFITSIGENGSSIVWDLGCYIL